MTAILAHSTILKSRLELNFVGGTFFFSRSQAGLTNRVLVRDFQAGAPLQATRAQDTWHLKPQSLSVGSRHVGLEPLPPKLQTLLLPSPLPAAPWHVDVMDGLVGSRLLSFVHVTSKNTTISIYKKEKNEKKVSRVQDASTSRITLGSSFWMLILVVVSCWRVDPLLMAQMTYLMSFLPVFVAITYDWDQRNIGFSNQFFSLVFCSTYPALIDISATVYAYICENALWDQKGGVKQPLRL